MPIFVRRRHCSVSNDATLLSTSFAARGYSSSRRAKKDEGDEDEAEEVLAAGVAAVPPVSERQTSTAADHAEVIGHHGRLPATPDWLKMWPGASYYAFESSRAEGPHVELMSVEERDCLVASVEPLGWPSVQQEEREGESHTVLRHDGRSMRGW